MLPDTTFWPIKGKGELNNKCTRQEMCGSAVLDRFVSGCDEKTAERFAHEWKTAGRSAREFREVVLTPAAAAMTQRFAQQAVYLPELLLFSRAARAAIRVIKDANDGNECSSAGKIVIGSLSWDSQPSLCRDVVSGLLQAGGWDVIDLGANVLPTRFADACAAARASVLIVAALSISAGRTSLPATWREVAALAEELEARGIRRQIRILVVGLPPDGLPHARQAADAVCDDLAEVMPAVERLAASNCA